jgi:transcriptional regulator with XRE-family HTH domain
MLNSEKYLVGLSLAIRHFSGETGLTQMELAKRCGVTQPTISRMMTSRNNTDFKTLISLAEAMGISPEELLKKAGELGEMAMSVPKELQVLLMPRDNT